MINDINNFYLYVFNSSNNNIQKNINNINNIIQEYINESSRNEYNKDTLNDIDKKFIINLKNVNSKLLTAHNDVALNKIMNNFLKYYHCNKNTIAFNYKIKKLVKFYKNASGFYNPNVLEYKKRLLNLILFNFITYNILNDENKIKFTLYSGHYIKYININFLIKEKKKIIEKWIMVVMLNLLKKETIIKQRAGNVLFEEIPDKLQNIPDSLKIKNNILDNYKKNNNINNSDFGGTTNKPDVIINSTIPSNLENSKTNPTYIINPDTNVAKLLDIITKSDIFITLEKHGIKADTFINGILDILLKQADTNNNTINNNNNKNLPVSTTTVNYFSNKGLEKVNKIQANKDIFKFDQ